MNERKTKIDHHRARLSNRRGKVHLVLLILGITIGVAVTLAGTFVLYKKMRGKNIDGKAFYLLNKGKEYVKNYAEEKIRGFSRQSKRGDENKEVSILHLDVHVDRALRKINPMIYGSNLSSKAEFEMDVARFGKDVGITNFRFPGGGSPGYRWKLGTYDFSDRADNAPLSNMENVMKFCQIAHAKLVIQVNIESGTPEEAAEWVRYMNKGLGVRVDYWELGNEAYGDWDKAYMPGEEYVKVIKAYSKAMKKADPTIKIGADWGGARYQKFDDAVIKGAANHIDFVSFHWYPSHINPHHKYKGRTHPLPEELMANSLAVGKLVQRFEDMVEKFAPQRKGKIEFTIMEWDGSWDAMPSDLDYEYEGMMWSLANAIFYADTLGQFALHGISVANHYTFQEVMFGLIRGWDYSAGWGGSRWDRKTIRPKGLALKLFANHFGDILIEDYLTGSPSYRKDADWRPDSYVGEVPYVTSYASRSIDGKSVTIVLINKHAEKDFKINISLNGADVDERGDVWILNGPDLKAQNDGSPEVVDIKKYDLSGLNNKFRYSVPAHSVSLLKIPVRLKSD